MFGKLLTRARSLFKSSPSPVLEQVELPPRESTPPTAEAENNAAPEPPVEPAEGKEHQTDGAGGDVLRYVENEFNFTMPLEEEERLILMEAKEKYEEAKLRLKEDSSPWEKKQLGHLKAMQYWCLQIHYRDRAQHFYKLRDEEPGALEQALRYCEKQIAYAPMAIRANRMDPQSKGLPQHYGYKQLAIIHEKQGRYDEAIRLCRQALEEGWKGDWETRVERVQKKREKPSSDA